MGVSRDNYKYINTITILQHYYQCITLMEERVIKLTYPTLQHFLRMLYTMNGNSSISDGQSDKKRGYKLLLKRLKSTFPVKNTYLPIMSFIITNFHAILLRCFSVLTNCFSCIFHFRQISKFKKGHCFQKKN